MYTSTLSDGSDLPPFISFSSTNQKFEISSTAEADAGSYSINLIAKVVNIDGSIVENKKLSWNLNVILIPFNLIG
jgi:hypothetical protein